MDRYVREDGLVGVLISPDYGAGWSTWNAEHREALLFDKDIIQMVLAKRHADIPAYVKKKYPEVYIGGYADLEVVFLEPLTRFVVREYDGYESLSIIDAITDEFVA